MIATFNPKTKLILATTAVLLVAPLLMSAPVRISPLSPDYAYAASSRLPKCNDVEVLSDLADLEKKAAREQITNLPPMELLALSVSLSAVATRNGKEIDASTAIAKLLGVLGGAKITYSDEREEITLGNTKHCAANMHADMVDVFGTPIAPKMWPVTYTLQLTEDGNTYVQGTGGADFEPGIPGIDVPAAQPNEDIANEMAKFRAQQQEQYNQQRQVQDR